MNWMHGDATGPVGSNTVVAVRNKSIPIPVTGGGQLTYDVTTDACIWYSVQVYTSLANAAADQANQVIGQKVIIFNTPATGEDGTYNLDSKTGNPADYTKISDATNTASEVAIVDAGNWYSSTDVEGALQEVGAQLGAIAFSGLTAGVNVLNTVAIASVRAVIWDVSVQDAGGTNVELQTVYAQHDGSAADYTVYGPGPTGTVDVTLSVDVSGADMRLLATITGAATWQGKVRRRSFDI
jgi:hypothetical protein